MPDFATVPRRHDRPRRRHRLRAVHRHPLPGAAPRAATTCGSRSAIAIDTAGRSVLFAGITVVISLLGMLLMGVALRPGPGRRRRRRSSPSRCVASLTLLPALLGFAGERVERHPLAGPHRRRLLVAVGLVGVGPQDRTRCSSAFPLAVDRAARSGFFVPPLKREVPHRAPKPRARDRSPTAGAGSSSTARGLRPSVGTLRPARAGRSRARPAARLLRREQLRRGHHHPAGLRPARRGLRPGLQRPAPARRRGARRAPTSTALDAVTDAVAADPDVAFVSPPQPNDPDEPDRGACGTSCPPPARRTRRPPSSSTGCATTCCPPAEDAAGVDVAVTGQRRRQRRLLRLPRRRACRTSSAPCWRCRSCC